VVHLVRLLLPLSVEDIAQSTMGPEGIDPDDRRVRANFTERV